ncbi:MAG: hypothetical protein ACXWV5_08855 [Flavitalea sp.]
MRKLAAILLLTISVVTHTEVAQFFKLPVFFAHYVEHRSENPALGLWDYVKLHYQSSQETPSDYDKDLKLPFKTSHIVQSGISYSLPVLPEQEPINLDDFAVITPSYKQLDETALPQRFSGSVFQPPRLILL